MVYISDPWREVGGPLWRQTDKPNYLQALPALPRCGKWFFKAKVPATVSWRRDSSSFEEPPAVSEGAQESSEFFRKVTSLQIVVEWGSSSNPPAESSGPARFLAMQTSIDAVDNDQLARGLLECLSEFQVSEN